MVDAYGGVENGPRTRLYDDSKEGKVIGEGEGEGEEGEGSGGRGKKRKRAKLPRWSKNDFFLNPPPE